MGGGRFSGGAAPIATLRDPRLGAELFAGKLAVLHRVFHGGSVGGGRFSGGAAPIATLRDPRLGAELFAGKLAVLRQQRRRPRAWQPGAAAASDDLGAQQVAKELGGFPRGYHRIRRQQRRRPRAWQPGAAAASDDLGAQQVAKELGGLRVARLVRGAPGRWWTSGRAVRRSSFGIGPETRSILVLTSHPGGSLDSCEAHPAGGGRRDARCVVRLSASDRKRGRYPVLGLATPGRCSNEIDGIHHRRARRRLTPSASRLVELPGTDTLYWGWRHRADARMKSTEFITGVRGGG